MRSIDFCTIQAKSLLTRCSRLQLLVFLFALLLAGKAYAQPCSGAPSFTINLSGSPDSIWTSPDTARAGDCCGSTNPDKCVEFVLTLDSQSAGIKLDIISGAMPGGALFYQIGCGTSYQVGQEICLSGVGPHRITFCKPGNNHNEYQIKSLPKPLVNGKLLINQACIGYLTAKGLIDTSIHWQSVPNNATYNSYLSCLNGCDSVSIIPTGSFPPTVTYRVCGIIDGGCHNSIFCDTATVRFVTQIGVKIQPQNPTVCFGGTNTTITAKSTGGLKPFRFTWSTGDTATADSMTSLSVGVGTYYVRMLDSLGCTMVTDTVVVTAYTMPIKALAGNDTNICTRLNYARLAGSVQVATGGKWIGGTGTYVPNDTTLTAVYYPSAAETLAGVAHLKLVTTGNGTCPADTDALQIFINPTPAPVITGTDTICAYKQTGYSATAAAGNTYLWSVTGGAIIGSNSNSAVSILWGASGTGVVTLTQTNSFSCDSTVSLNVTLIPAPLTVINGPDSVCEYKQTSHSTNKTSGNTYQWSVTGGTIIGNNTDTIIRVIWAGNGNGNITLLETNTFGCDSTVSLPITITPTPAPVITGPTSVCEHKQSSYSTNTTAGNTYQWSVTGGTIVGSSTNSTLTVAWGANGSGSITLKQTNTFGCDSTVSINTTIHSTPVPAIAGPDSVCAYKQAMYGTNNPGNTYQWSVTGGTIVGSNTASIVTIAWGANGTGTVSVKQTNPFTCDSTVSFSVVITPTPIPTVNGLNTTCEYKQYTYTTNTTPGNTYQWSVTGGTIIGNNTNSSIDILWGANGSANITLTQTNIFGCDSTINWGVTIAPTPVPVITGPSTVCEYKQTSYSTNTTPGNTYQWGVSGGTIIGSSTDSVITVAWDINGSGSIVINQTNTFGCDSTVLLNITITPTPAPVITGPATVCEYKQTSYSTNTTVGNTYQWSVTGGTIVGSSTDSLLNVAWAANGSGSITLKQTNSFNCDSTVSINITINPTPAPVITGPATVCAYKQTSYSTNTTVGNTYQWSVTGGTIVGSSNGSTLTVAWGINGSGNITLKQTNSFNCDSTVSINVTITPTPAPVITGPSIVCEYKQTTYTTNTTPGNTYQWIVTGGTIVGSNNSSSLTVAWGTNGAGSITLKQTNSFNCDSTVSMNITINPTPAPTINGLNTTCEYKQYTYNTNTTAGNTYQWSVTGGTIIGSNTSSSIDILWGANGSGSLTVKQTNSFNCDSTVTLNITITPTPAPVITGPSTVCEYKRTSYSTNTTPGNTYQWGVSGGTIIGSDVDTIIQVLWGANGSGSIVLNQTNSFGCDSTVVLNITITPTPAPVITGPSTVCEYKQTSYSTNTTAGNTYQWIVTGGTVVGSSADSLLTVAWAANGSGSITLKQTNSFNCDSTVSINVTITPTPAPVITGPVTVCEYKQTSYSTNTTAGNTYQWTVAGGTVVGSSTDSILTVAWAANGSGSITLKQTNSFNCDSTVSVNVTITPTPAPVITGPSTVCAYKQTSYSTNTTAGNTYQWTVTGGTIVGSSNSSSLTVAWGINGSGSITLKQTNTFGCDSIVSMNITITPTPAPTINGLNTVCAYKQYTYVTNTTAGNTYQWTATGGTIIGSSNNPTIDVLWAANGSGSLTVKQTNSFNCDSTITLNITITPTPAPVITGPSTVCEYKLTTYTTNTTPGNVYQWGVSGGTIIGSDVDTIIQVLWSANGSGSIVLNQTNSFGCDSTVVLNITITPTPAPVITGPATVCEYKQTSYSTNTTPGNTYQWIVTGGTVVGSSNDSLLTVAWAANGSGSITLKQTNSFNCDSTVSINITITPTPAPVITGPSTVCAYKQTSYSTNTTAGNTYQWSVTGGTIVGSSNSSTLTVAWGINGSGSITLKQTNTYGCDSTVVLNITITPTPAPVITGPSTFCAYKQAMYGTNNPGNTYQWSVTGGTIVGSSTASIVTVAWGANGTGTVSMKQTNSFGCDSTVSFNVIITPTPAPTINGLNTVCEYKQYTYVTNTTAGNTYQWTVTGGTIIGSNTNPIIDILWGTNGSGNITLTQTNTFSCDSTISWNITIRPTPAPIITGPSTVCEYKLTTYTTNTTPGNVYQWGVTGGTIIGSATDTILRVLWDANGSGSIVLNQMNSFGCDSTVSMNIIIRPTPVPVITGPATVCEYKQTSYSTNTTAGNAYQWVVTGGSIIGSNAGSTINVLWSTNGSGNVTVTQTNSFGCDSTVSMNITITPTPAPVITGPDTVCEYKQTTYTTNTTAGNTYQWLVTGGTIIGSNAGSTINVLWNTNGSGSITLKQTNTYGCDSTVSLTIIINPTPAPVITGPSTVCEYKQTSYSTNTTAGNTYQWLVTGGTIAGSSTNSSITVAWAANGNGSITLKQTNTFGCDSTVSLPIIINPTPAPVITGPDSVCAYKQTSYSTNTTPGNAYQWTVTGGTIVGSSTNSSITVAWGINGSGSITLKQTNTFSCDSAVSLSITVMPTPAPVITGPNTVCEYKQTSYRTNTTAGNTYQWVVTGGAIIGNTSDTMIRVKWGAAGSGSITLTQTNSFGCDSTVSLNITITPTPAPVIAGSDSVCEYRQTSYNTNTPVGTTYQWNVTGGFIVNSNTDSVLDVMWGTTGGGTVTLTQTNAFGCDSSVSMNIVITPTPVPVINGPDTVCAYKQVSYRTNTTAGNTYQWTVTGGTIVGSNTDTMLTVAWGANGVGNIILRQTNIFGCDSMASLAVRIQPTPAPSINGPDSICAFKSSVFSTASLAGVKYKWIVTGGVIAGSDSSASINVVWGTPGGGNVSLTVTNSLGCDSTIAKTINILNTPTPLISGDTMVCEFKQYIYTYSTSYTPTTIYQWTVSNGSIIGSATDTSVVVLYGGGAGTALIQLHVTNANGCDSLVAQNIVITPTPRPLINGPDTICEKKLYTYTSANVAGDVYQWSVTGAAIIDTSGNTLNVVWSSTGNKTITLTQRNAYGCDSTVIFKVYAKPTPTPFLNGPITICEYKTATYYSRKVSNDQYTWNISGGSILSIIADTQAFVQWGNLDSGIIYVTETNSQGCDSTVMLKVDLKPTPIPIIKGPNPACEHKSYIYSSSYYAGHSYQWNVTGGSWQQLNDTVISVKWGPTGTGTISLKVISPFLCDSSIVKNIDIKPTPVPNFTGSLNLCAYSGTTYSVSTVAAGHQYQWSITGGNIIGATNASTVAVVWGPPGAGTLTLKQTSPDGCDSTITKIIQLRARPVPVINGPAIACAGSLIYTYSATPVLGHYKYDWAVTSGNIMWGAGTPQVGINWKVKGNQVITLHVTDSITLCDSTVTLNIFIDSVLKPNLSANSLAGCLPLSIQFVGNQLTPGYNYLWDFGDGSSSTQLNPHYVYTKPGVFNVKVVVENSNGCRDSSLATVIVNYVPKADFEYTYQNERIYAHEDTVFFENKSSGGNMFVWQLDKGHSSGTDTIYNDKTQYLEPGFYDVILTTIDTTTGCESTIKKEIEVRVREELYVPNAFSPNGDGVNDFFYVSVTHIVEFELLIFDRWGEILFRSNDTHFRWDGMYQGKPAQPDVYAYLLSGKGYHGKFFSKSGTITLLR